MCVHGLVPPPTPPRLRRAHPILHHAHRREKFGDYFGITVAGYPEAHPDGIVEDTEQMDKNYWADIAYLKKKVRGGGACTCGVRVEERGGGRAQVSG